MFSIINVFAFVIMLMVAVVLATISFGCELQPLRVNENEGFRR